VPIEPRLELLYTLTADLGPPTTVGATPHGTRLIVPVTGGSFQGPRLTGRILPGGGDWLLVRPDGVGELDVRATLETDDGALLYVTYRGYISRVFELLPRWSQGEEIPREEHYFVTTPYFETAAPAYDWLQRTVVVGLGQLIPGGVRYDVFTVA
jgi:hypothetical protein